ncbi:MAG: OmpA family protein, partial [bacterium]
LIENIAEELGFVPRFDDGLDKPLRRIAQISQSLQTEKRELIKELEEKNAEIKKLNEQLQAYREKERGLQAELEEKRYKLEMKKRREDLINSVEKMFAAQEAHLLRQGNDIIIRLIGLTFPSGKAIIEPEYFRLLATVQRAIRKFPNSPITIEGHTDSIGDDRFNENLSYERAMAVKKYLLANMGLDDSRITALGYGETRPIASNETGEGRAQNRRIDIVISIGEEVL